MLVSFSLCLFYPSLSPIYSTRTDTLRERERERRFTNFECLWQTRAIKRVTLVSFDPAHAGKINFIRTSLTPVWATTLSPLPAHRKLAPPSFIDSFNEFLAGNKRCRRKSPYDFGGEITARAGERFIKRRQRSDVGEGVECVGCGRRKIDDISIQYPSRSLVATSRFQPFTRDTNIYIVNFQRRVYRISDRV